MKKELVLGFTLGLLSLFSQESAQAVSLNLNLSSNTLEVGQTLTADIIISDLGDFSSPSVAAFDLDLEFDPSQLSFDGVTFGNLLGDPAFGEATTNLVVSSNMINLLETSALFANSNQCSTETGLSVGDCNSLLSPFLDDLQPSSFVLATLTFDTVGEGNSLLNLSINELLDAEIPSQALLASGLASSASVNVGSPATKVPEPSISGIYWILSVSLGLVFSQKKRIRN